MYTLEKSTYQIILASQSPRRRELLAGMDLDFVVADRYECEENYPSEIFPEDVSAYLANKKSEFYPHKLLEKQILLTADTVVIVDNSLLGKPSDEKEAVEMLNLLSGRKHKVITAFCLRTPFYKHTKSVCSIVEFSQLSISEIQYYIHKYKPYDKAGAYGIQEWIGYIGVEHVEGCYYNIMGLPTSELYKELKYLGSQEFSR